MLRGCILNASLCPPVLLRSPYIHRYAVRSLERLCLDGCNLQAIKLSAPRLKELSVRGCASLTELDAACWQLTKLDIGPVEASGTHNKSLAKLTIASGALRQMEWVKLK